MDVKVDRLAGSQARVLPYLFAIDLIIAAGLTVASLAYLEVPDVTGAVGLSALAYVIHVGLWFAYLRLAWVPLRAWEQQHTGADDAQLEAADRAVEGIPAGLARVYALSWAVHWGTVTALAWFAAPDVIELGRHDLIAVGFEVVASLIGASVLIFPLVRLLLLQTKLELRTELSRRGLDQERAPAPLAPRFVVLAMGLALAPVTWQFGTTWLTHAHAARTQTMLELRRTVGSSQHVATRAELPPAVLAELGGDEAVAVLDRRNERVFAAAPLDAQRWAVAEAEVEVEAKSFWIGSVALILAVVGWVLATAAGSIRLLIGPLGRLDDAVRRVVEVGDLAELGRIPIAYEDEVSGLTRRFNAMLDLFDELAAAARVVSEGDLSVQISGEGDLQRAFSAMVLRLHELVSQIRLSAMELASTAAEIHAIALGQEDVMRRQATGIGEASDAMRRLSDSAGAISSAANAVLGDAEQARGHSDEVGAKITELTNNLGRIGDLLELIREISDRSDLLALNGSLEATRAGEAGRGFSLVASEMRRLAERVTRTVADVRATISDIAAASAASVAATEAGRLLTGNTSDAAKTIVEVTETQNSETRLVSTSVGEIAAVISGSVATTEQTRAAADGLREQAIALERLIRDFRTEQD